MRFCMNNAAAGDTINFGVSGTIAINSQLPTIGKNLTIDGVGQSVEIWGGGTYRIFQVSAGVTAEIDNLSIDDGYTSGSGGGLYNSGTLKLNGDTFFNNKADAGGGAIENYGSGANLTMYSVSLNNNNSELDHGGGLENISGTVSCSGHCSIVNNQAWLGGGIYNGGGSVNLYSGTQVSGNSATFGGGIYTLGTGASFFITGFTGTAAIQYNSATTQGGGIMVASGTLTLSLGASVSNNKVTATNGLGGGVFVSGGTLKMTGGSINDNSATNGRGGGIYISGGQLTLKDVNVKFNSANWGGGMYLKGGKATVSSGWVQENTAGTSGGGIYNWGGSLTLKSDVAVNDNMATNLGGGLYLGNNSYTDFINCLVSGNSTGGSQQTTGWGVYQEKAAFVSGIPVGLIDNDDPGGKPVKQT